jgi:predicted homoserine dehydrogenase-like protein
MDTVRIGVIGAGYWGPKLIRNFHEISNASVTLVSDLR